MAPKPRHALRLRWGVVTALALLLPGCLDSGLEVTTFIVTVPPETPPEDTIVFHAEETLYPMEREPDGRWRVTVDLARHEGNEGVRYGFTRGGHQAFGEEGWLGNVGSRFYERGTGDLVESDVKAWKWIPKEPLPGPDFPVLADETEIAPRERFWAGPAMADFWMEGWQYQFNATVDQASGRGYAWVELMPPWDLKQADPPVLSNEDVTVPAWPTDMLRKEIRAYKAAGLKVLLAPQVCCTPVPHEAKGEEWWNAWYDEYERFTRYHADLAREEGVDALALGSSQFSLPLADTAPAFASERWSRILDVARTPGVPIGYQFYAFKSDTDPIPHPVWPLDDVDFVDRLDFLAIAEWNWLVEGDDFTLAQIEEAVRQEFRGFDLTHNLTGKPLVFAQVAYASETGGAGRKTPETHPEIEDPALHLDRSDPQIQAMIYEALFREVAKRSYVEGLFAFGYTYADAPLVPEVSIREKPAEDVFEAWSAALRGSTVGAGLTPETGPVRLVGPLGARGAGQVPGSSFR